MLHCVSSWKRKDEQNSGLGMVQASFFSTSIPMLDTLAMV